MSVIDGKKMGFGNLLDGLQSTDERLERVNQQLSQMSSQIGAVADALERQTGQDVDVMDEVLNEYSFDMSATIPANTTRDSPVIEERTVRFDARLDGVVIGWPSGANNQVGVQIRTAQGEILFPRDEDNEYVAMDDFSDEFSLIHAVDKDAVIEVRYINLDPNNGHFMNTVPQIKERRM